MSFKEFALPNDIMGEGGFCRISQMKKLFEPCDTCSRGGHVSGGQSQYSTSDVSTPCYLMAIASKSIKLIITRCLCHQLEGCDNPYVVLSNRSEEAKLDTY